MPELHFVTNRIASGVRRITHAGREYLIAPVVAIRAGVLNGELAQAEEIAHFVPAWNGIPVPLGHPRDGQGLPISANTPDLVAQCPGRFWNAEFVGDRLRGEIWLDVELCGRLGDEALTALQRIEAGEPVEVSTGYFRDLEEVSGTYNGEEYFAVQHNLRPDHLALLLHQVGACSWKDGCGVPRINLAVNADGQITANQNTGVMVAFFLKPEDAQALALQGEGLPDGSEILPAGELHVTLAYLGDMSEVTASQSRLLEFLAAYTDQMPIMRVQLNGVGRFTSAPELHPVFALVEGDALHDMRQTLVYWLSEYGARPERAYGFQPHITLAYVPAAAPMPNVLPAPRELVFDRLALAWGDQVTVFPLRGEVREVEAANNQREEQPRGGTLRSALAALGKLLGLKMQTNEEVLVDKPQLIEKLAANSRCPLKRPALEALQLEDLQDLDKALQANCGGQQQTQAATVTQANAQAQTAAAPELPADLVALAGLVKDLGGADAVRQALQAVQANAGQEKADLVADLVANSSWTEDELKALPVEQLRKLSAMLQPADYAGRGLPRTNAQGGELIEAPMPVAE